MFDPKSPLSRLDRQELAWLTGILKDACRERLEKNLVSQAFEERLNRRGPVEGRPDPRPSLKIWEPRYRKLLDVATELHAQVESEGVRAAAKSLARRGEMWRAESDARVERRPVSRAGENPARLRAVPRAARTQR